MVKFNPETKLWQADFEPYPYSMDTFMGEIILEELKKSPQRVAQIFHDENSQLTCDELRLKSIRVAQNLRKFGVKADDVVGVICNNSHEVSFLFNGCILIGAPIHPLEPTFEKDDIKHLFRQTTPKVVVCEVDALSKVKEALSELKNKAKIFAMSNNDVDGASKFSDLIAPTHVEEDFEAPKFPQKSDEKLLAILCSSGTTGLPKGVKKTHAQCLTWAPTEEASTTRSLCFSPTYWSFGFFPHIHLAFRKNDIRIMTRQGFSIKAFNEIVEKYKVNHVNLSPRDLARVIHSESFSATRYESVNTFLTMGTGVSAMLRGKFSEMLPDSNLEITYGATEVSGISRSVPGEYNEKLSIGSVLYWNVSVKIVDENHQNLGVGETGEICARPPFKFQGYYNNAEASTSALDSESFYMTGDIGYFDDDGSLFLIDRKKEIINCNGFHVNPSELEEIIGSIEGVELVSVVGIPDPFATSLPAAVVVKRPSYENLTEMFIIDYVAARLPYYKQLNGGVLFASKMPLNPAGKIMKREVLELVLKDSSSVLRKAVEVAR